MASEWKISTVGEFCPFIYGKALPERSRIAGAIPVISSAGVSGSHHEPLINGGGVVIGRKGTVGSVTLCKSAFWAIDTAFYVPDAPHRNLVFSYYLLKTLGLERMNSDSAVPGLNRDNAHARSISVPPIEEQNAIAHILGTLDDKIELNRRMNVTLEAMARALFKSWFVDFDPVRAKQEGHWQRGRSLPGLPAHLYDLFPGRLVESALGEIPEGWEVKSLDEIAEFLNGLALQKFPVTDPADSLPVIKIAELRNGVSAKSDRASRNVSEKYIIKNGDFLFSWSGSLLAKFWTEGEGALNQHLFKVTSERYPMWFISHWVHYHLKEFQSIAASKATTMGHIQRGHLKSAMAICPAADALEKFDVVMAPLVDQAIQNELETRALAELRDTLLPKLISGELRVPDTEAFLRGRKI